MRAWQLREKAPRWAGDRLVIDGYILVPAPDGHPRTAGGRVAEHHLVVEKVLGRYLKYVGPHHPENEEVHHINFDRADNRPENLLVCTKLYHREIHGRIRKLGLEATFKAMVA